MTMTDWSGIVRDRLKELTGGPPDSELVDELAGHLAQLYEDARSAGTPEVAARDRALRVLDAPGPLIAAARARRGSMPRRITEWIRHEPPAGGKGFLMKLNLAQDLRYALRMLLRAPAFSAIAMLTFAVGIGANTAIFSVVNGVLLRPLPYPDAERITLIWMDNRRQGIREDITSYPTYMDWRSQGTSYQHMAAFRPTAFTLTGGNEPERLEGSLVTANFFDVMGVSPIRGRVFTQANETPGQDALALISHGLWQRVYGGRDDVLGKTITLNGRPHEVIGVMPSELQWPEKAELWTPLAPPQQAREARGGFWLPVIGRLKPGISPERAQTEMSAIAARLEEAYPVNRGFGAYVVPLHDQLVGDIERPLLILLASVGFVLLIACANLANLMLGRTAGRRKELAIRTALGAGRGRLLRQLVTEAFVLALFGGSLGLVLAYWSIQSFIAVGGDTIPRPDAIAVDARVLGFTLALASMAALLAGLLPAWSGSRAAVARNLREGARQTGGAANHRTRSVLVAAEVALALVLLTGAGLLLRTLWSMQGIDRGFSTGRIATATVSVSGTAYPQPADVRTFYARLLERVRALPGVESAATGTGVYQPLVTSSGVYSIEGRPLPPPEERVEYPVEAVSPGYFETLGVSLVSGRSFREQDHADAPRVVVINETLARVGWPGQDPIGRRMKAGDQDSNSPWMTVVGVIADIRRADVQRTIRPELYMCALQATPRTQRILVRVAGDPQAILPSLRREVQALDPQLPLFNARTLASEFGETLNQPRFQATLFAAFAGIALLLAAIGVYGVTSNAVSQRTQEVGIRMALGAKRGDVLRLIVGQHVRPALAGVALGLVSAVILSGYLQSLLYGVGATDPATFATVALALLAVATLACWLPARRATRVDPLIALRAE
jgi:putative ABC transport system permease protein